MQLYVAAQRQPRELPDRADAVPPRGDGTAEADGEHLNVHPAPARREVVAELMDEDQNAKDHKEGEAGAEEIGDHVQHSFGPVWFLYSAVGRNAHRRTAGGRVQR